MPGPGNLIQTGVGVYHEVHKCSYGPFKPVLSRFQLSVCICLCVHMHAYPSESAEVPSRCPTGNIGTRMNRVGFWDRL